MMMRRTEWRRPDRDPAQDMAELDTPPARSRMQEPGTNALAQI